MAVNVISKRVLALLLVCAMLAACDSDSDRKPQPVRETVDRTAPMENPLKGGYETPFGVPPFHQLRPEHFAPALREAMDRADETLAAIVATEAAADFDNTIAPLEQADQRVTRIARLWYGMDAVGQEAAREAGGTELDRLLNRHQQRVLSDRELFARIEQVREATASGDVDDEHWRLTDQIWQRFRRGGGHLGEKQREELAELERRIADLDRRYAELRRAATHRHELIFEDDEALQTLPESLVLLARRSARDRGHREGWAFTLHTHSFYPFMRHFPERDARRELYAAWMERYRDVQRRDEDLGRVIERLAELRAERARLLGFDSHIEFLLDDAAMPDRQVLDELIQGLATAASAKAQQELEKISGLAARDGLEGPLEPWDWWYYRERLYESELGLLESELRPYFELDLVREGLFALANRLWGLTFHPRSELPSWHMEAPAFEVRDEPGTPLGILYFDPVHRAGKQGGAWTSFYRSQHRRDGDRIRPVAAIVANVSPPAAGTPALLSPDQVRTVFHEFGHALHGLLSEVDHAALAGTNVPPDFVEFPAILLEHWALQPEVLRSYARHHETGSLIPDQVVEALQRRDKLTAGLETLELLAAIELEMVLHGAAPGEVPDLETAENRVRAKLELPAMISPRHHGGGLASLFASQRSGGDLRTLWSQLLAADAFAAFMENGLINRELAARLRDEILSRGNSRDPMASWRAFRGRAPDVRHLLRARGLASDQDWNTPRGE